MSIGNMTIENMVIGKKSRRPFSYSLVLAQYLEMCKYSAALPH